MSLDKIKAVTALLRTCNANMLRLNEVKLCDALDLAVHALDDLCLDDDCCFCQDNEGVKNYALKQIAEKLEG